MEALHKPLTFQGLADPCRMFIPDKDICNSGTRDEANYVDLNNSLDKKADGTKTVKVTFTGEGSQLAIFKCNSDTTSDSGDGNPGDRERNGNFAELPIMDCKSINKKKSGDIKKRRCVAGDLLSSSEIASSSEFPKNNADFRDSAKSQIHKRDIDTGPQTAIVPCNFKSNNTSSDSEELQYTDIHLRRRMETEADVSMELSDHCTPNTMEDESHYITTHEIQLSELDHDADYDIGLGSCWDLEDDNLAYSFFDYTSIDNDEAIGRRQVLEGGKSARVKSNQIRSNNINRRATSRAAVSSKHENDLCDSDKCASSDEGLSKNQKGRGNSAGQIHLSIKTTSRAINEPSNIQEKENIRYHAKHEGDMSRYVFRDAKAEKICDSAKCFIAAPCRLHFGNKLKGKDVNEYSSGASSAVSELDDADKEVRNLTARAFRSLAYPYFDAINFSTSSESSASEHGLGINRWSTFVDLKYGNMTHGRDKNLVSHKSATSTFEIAKNAEGKGIKGLTLANIKAPQTQIFALNGNLSDAKNASSSTKKIELMGKFGQGQSGVITLTETLNFRCNVKTGVPGSDGRAKFAQNATGSRSTDEVTNILPSELGNEASKQPCNPGETMEDTHKKAIFASSLLKNVISKKMQFEQERKMERGEISESSVLSPCLSYKEQDTHKERVTLGESKGLQRQSSKYSEAGSDLTIFCLDELGDIVDTNSSCHKDESPREDILTLASETNFESTNEAGIDTKKGAFEASKSTLLRSQNSAFRSWRDGELEFQKEHKSDKTPVGKPPTLTDKLGETDIDDEVANNLTMTHLFVPSIQVLSEESELGKPLPNFNYSTRAATDHGNGGDGKLRSDKTLYVADATRSVVTSKSPEIKISLRSVKENKGNPFNIAKLLTPNIGCNTANLIKTADDSKCHALLAPLKGESSEKVPHFMVRDIRENKSKLQTPIHQVRDVRKLVKSSYHFVSLDNNEIKASAFADLHSEFKASKTGPCRNPESLSPIVIKCQSVNTNSNVKQSGNLIEVSQHCLAEDILEANRSSPQPHAEGAKNGITPTQRPTGRTPIVTAKQPNGDPAEATVGVKTETGAPKRKQDIGERKPESNMANQAALEKLQAAVKTMEQLYVFDRNEWKRKTEPQPITDSHVLSLIASEEHDSLGKDEFEEELVNITSSLASGNTERLVRRDSYPNSDKSPPPVTTVPVSEVPPKKEGKDCAKLHQIPCGQKEKGVAKSQSHQSETFSNRNAATFTQSQKSSTISSTSYRASQTYASAQAPFSTKGFAPKSPKLPVSLKISHPKRVLDDWERPNGTEADKPFLPFGLSATADSENYLTIPVKAKAMEAKPGVSSSREQTSVYTFTATSGKPQTTNSASHPSQGDTSRQENNKQSPKRSSIIMETRSPDSPTATIYHHPVQMAMPSAQPQVICFSSSVPQQPAVDFQQIQRKMLLDPTTGHYYLVDTPVQPATKRLFDPETGQYVEVPMPQQPMAPVPMPIAPLALNPAAYTPTYMIYPGFLPTPTMLPTRTMQSQMSMHSEVDSGDKVPQMMGAPGEVTYMESPYYIPTGKSPLATPVSQHISTRSAKGLSDGKSVISITSQQGPRIIAPPSFDGTTMSFVVEHRGII